MSLSHNFRVPLSHFWSLSPLGQAKLGDYRLFRKLVAAGADVNVKTSKVRPQQGVEKLICGKSMDNPWNIYPPVSSNMAMENGPSIHDFPVKISIHRGFSIAMFDYQQGREIQKLWEEVSVINRGEDH